MSWRTERSAERYTDPPLPVSNSVAYFCNHLPEIVTHNLRWGVTQRYSEYTLALARWAAYRMALHGLSLVVGLVGAGSSGVAIKLVSPGATRRMRPRAIGSGG